VVLRSQKAEKKTKSKKKSRTRPGAFLKKMLENLKSKKKNRRVEKAEKFKVKNGRGLHFEWRLGSGD
jgi:hypothetical protein